jgi:multidrug efflux pump subunit AcrB
LLLKGENHGPAAGPARGLFARFHAAFERGFETIRHGYSRSLTGLIEHRFIIPAFMLLLLALGVVTFPFVGRDFFPAIDGGQVQLHVRAPAGTRIEATEKIFQQGEDNIREIIPESERELIVDNIGLPARAYNLAFTDGSTRRQ